MSTQLPTYCLFEVTWNCNLNCKMCPRNLFGTVGKRLNMKLEDFNKVLDQLPQLKLANFAGLGEPFIHPDIYTMFNNLAKRNVNVLMTTNGTFLTEKNVKKLANTKFSMHISIDTPIEESFKKIRGYSLSTIVSNLKRLKQIRPDISLVIQSLFMKNTMREFKHFIPFAKELDAKIALLYPISFKHADEALYEPFMEKDFKQLKSEFTVLCNEEGVGLYDRPIDPSVKRCTEPWNGPMINPKGEMFGCCYVYEGRDYNTTPKTWNEWYLNKKVVVPQGDYIFGNAFTDDINTVWSNNKYNELRRMVDLCNQISFSPDKYIELRNNIDLNRKRFSYCRICLWRWNQVC